MKKPMIGETKRASMIFNNPLNWIAFTPACVNAAPTIPPINAWDELLGMPSFQENKFHRIELISATKITCKVIAFGSAIPRPMEFATATPKMKGPENSARMVIPNAVRGEYARDETMVDTTFRESTTPLRNPNSKARLIIVKIIGDILFRCLRSVNSKPLVGEWRKDKKASEKDKRHRVE